MGPKAEHDKRHRKIRSFVVRAGRMTAGQERAWHDLWPIYGIDFDAQPIDLDARYARLAPRVLEIGFGTGDALLAYARVHPEHDCLGIEVHPPGVGHLMLKAQEENLSNIRVICHDAVEVLAVSLPPGSFDEIHIFFPDPWHKKRHHKRRLIQPPFVELLATSLKSQGTLRLATDWQHYAEQMRAVLDADFRFDNVANDAGTGAPESTSGFVARAAHRPLTRFERRGHRLGHGVWDMAYRKK